MERSNENSSYIKDTELSLGLPGTNNGVANKKRSYSEIYEESSSGIEDCHVDLMISQPKIQVIGWPPIRSYRKNNLQISKTQDESKRMYVKVSMDGAPFLRKIDLMLYKDYKELFNSLEEMFKVKGSSSEYEPTYEDKDGDWMLVGDVPWDMFLGSCKRLRLMIKSSQTKGLAC